ncbi:MAG: outer membrane protein assembly factor BamE [Azoarcus sp.]|jgi:outer membrane protein assembly factor BamE|nr:outer membrane protein assembly factor BamE [Azoarcus sp.]
MRFTLFPLTVSLAASLAACSFDTLVGHINPYRIDIRQGNHVDKIMLAQLKPGMTREQVRFVLGSPLVADVFRTDRWDYVYRFSPGRGEVRQHVISVFFSEDRFDHIEGELADDGEGMEETRSRVIEVPAPVKD